MQVEHQRVEYFLRLDASVAENTQARQQKPLAVAGGGGYVADQLIHGLGVFVEVIPSQPNLQGHRPHAKIACEVCGVGHGLQPGRGVNLAGPALHPLRNLLGGARVMIDGLFQKPRHLSLWLHGVDLFHVVLGKRGGRRRNGWATELEKRTQRRDCMLQTLRAERPRKGAGCDQDEC